MTEEKSKQFLALVKEMRERQRGFFKYHDAGNLQESKRLEREVDKFIAELEREPSRQTTLFN